MARRSSKSDKLRNINSIGCSNKHTAPTNIDNKNKQWINNNRATALGQIAAEATGYLYKCILQDMLIIA